MVGHGGSSSGSYLADPTSPIPSHCASIVTTSTLRVKNHTNTEVLIQMSMISKDNTSEFISELYLEDCSSLIRLNSIYSYTDE